MTLMLYIATAMGLYIAAQVNGQWQVVRHVLTDQSLTSVAVAGDVLLAGTRDGIWHSADHGRTWQRANRNLGIRHVRWMAAETTGKTLFLVGTEPAGIFVSRDVQSGWTLSTDVTQLRDRLDWFLPYSAEAGCVRGFSSADTGDGRSRIYAAVEVGGVLISEDRGLTWQLADGSDGKPQFNRDLGTKIHPDVHSISVHPEDKNVVTAPTGGGLYRSMDGGKTWRNIYPSYIRAAWVNPEDHRHIIAGPADGVSRNGRIESTTDGGKTWQDASTGLRTPWPRHMTERFAQAGDLLFAILSNGQLWSRNLDNGPWQHRFVEIERVNAVAVGIR